MCHHKILNHFLNEEVEVMPKVLMKGKAPRDGNIQPDSIKAGSNALKMERIKYDR